MNILITGSSKGIGYQLVIELLKQQENKVLAVARTEKALIQLQEEAGTDRLEILPYDLEQVLQEPDAFKKETEKRLGMVHRLVNNAGTLINMPFRSISPAELEKVYRINVSVPFFTVQALLPLLKTGSHIVNISSMGGFQGSAKFAGLSAYSSSKAALASLTECMAEELKDRKISANCLALGAVQTEMLEAAFPGFKAPLTPEEISRFIAWFTLEGASYFNGKILPVSTGTP